MVIKLKGEFSECVEVSQLDHKSKGMPNLAVQIPMKHMLESRLMQSCLELDCIFHHKMGSLMECQKLIGSFVIRTLEHRPKAAQKIIKGEGA